MEPTQTINLNCTKPYSSYACRRFSTKTRN